jgi:hypothetical protein
MTDLDKLIAAVEAGTLCAGELCISEQDVALIEAVFPMNDDDEVPELIGLAMDGSLDAALRLHEDLLPGYGWGMWRTMDHLPDGTSRPMYGCNLPMTDTAYAETPARAWLLAILRALKAKGDA